MKGNNGSKPVAQDNPHKNGDDYDRAARKCDRDYAREDAANERAHERSLSSVERQNNARLKR